MTFSRRSIFYFVLILLASIFLFRWRTTLKNLIFRPEAEGQLQPKFSNPFEEGKLGKRGRS